MLRMHALCVAAVLLAIGTIDSTVAGQRVTAPAFEVASVKANKLGPRSIQRAALQAGDRVTFTNVTLLTLIQSAYAPLWEISGGPSWIGSVGQPNLDAERYDVAAKADTPSTRDELVLMLRTLLVDRFKLMVHQETKIEPIWALVLARKNGKLGPNLRPAAASCAALREAAQTKSAAPCGGASLANAPMTGKMSVHGFTVDQLGIVTLDVERRRVVDRTGLTGPFDWDLTWTPERFRQGPFDRDRFPTIDPDGPSIFAALEEQLGLKLESQKGENSVLVIDHVEHPSED